MRVRVRASWLDEERMIGSFIAAFVCLFLKYNEKSTTLRV